MKDKLLYGIKWQLGTPVVATGLFILNHKLSLDYFTSTIIVNIIGAIIFYKIDEWIFSKKNKV